ncbi:hypothetical protein [Bacillus albus]|uniref:hypothetical protein n=1 Tax=Bacillus albus TaxID=2026189 RepID=UPI001020CEF2|nr:hypothetical protein [Bacillus albus]
MSNFKFLISLLLILAFGASSAYITTAEYMEQPTLRDKLSQPTPMVSSMEVIGYHDGVYVLANVNGDEQDIGNYALEGTYKLGDVVTILWATEDSTEIAGETLVGTADELDLPHGRDSK